MKNAIRSFTTSFLFLLTVLSIVTGCSSVQHTSRTSIEVVKTPTAVNLQDSDFVKSTLLEQYKEWYRTPYRMGGLNKRGIDCSGFTYVTFRSKLGRILPRTTDLQVQTGRQVARRNLQIGDLVFFKTSLFYKHVGVYLGDSKFLHASTSSGVIISNLNDRYWNENYWTARRIDS